MTSLLGYLDLALDSAESEDHSHYLTQMGAVMRKMHREIEFTRDYEELGGSEPQWQDVGVIYHQISQLFSESLINYQEEVSGIEVYADRMLEKAIYNLIDNSIRHGDHVTTISVYMEKDRGWDQSGVYR